MMRHGRRALAQQRVPGPTPTGWTIRQRRRSVCGVIISPCEPAPMPDPGLSSRDRHQQFLRDAAANAEVWVLAHADDLDSWATSELAVTGADGLLVDRPVVPVWSARQGAQDCANGPWADYAPQRISLDDFIELALQGLHEQGVLVGTNWNADLHGHDLDAAELAHELAEVMASPSR